MTSAVQLSSISASHMGRPSLILGSWAYNLKKRGLSYLTFSTSSLYWENALKTADSLLLRPYFIIHNDPPALRYITYSAEKAFLNDTIFYNIINETRTHKTQTDERSRASSY